MDREELVRRERRLVIIFIGIVLIAGIIFTDSLSIFLKAYLLTAFGFSFLIGNVGSSRKIGFSKAFFLSLLLSPLIGLIIVFNSDKLSDEQYKKELLKITNQHPVSISSMADELVKLNELRKEGILTEEEFASQKATILARTAG